MSPTRPLLSIFFSHLDHILEGRNARLIEVAREVEAAGADQVVFSEHVALAQVIEGTGEASKFPFKADENYPEPMVAMAAIAGATTRLRVASGILIAPLRPAIVLAKMAATLDQMSNGRLDLGLGFGWHEPEFRAVGLEAGDGPAIMEETVLACRALWTGQPATFHGRFITFDRLVCRPMPLRGRDLPVWLAGAPTAKGADRVARLGQGWLPFSNLSADQVRRGADRLRAAEAKHGLLPRLLGIRASLPFRQMESVDAMLDFAFAEAPALIEAGVRQIQLPLWKYISRLDQVGPTIAAARLRLDAI